MSEQEQIPQEPNKRHAERVYKSEWHRLTEFLAREFVEYCNLQNGEKAPIPPAHEDRVEINRRVLETFFDDGEDQQFMDEVRQQVNLLLFSYTS